MHEFNCFSADEFCRKSVCVSVSFALKSTVSLCPRWWSWSPDKLQFVRTYKNLIYCKCLFRRKKSVSIFYYIYVCLFFCSLLCESRVCILSFGHSLCWFVHFSFLFITSSVPILSGTDTTQISICTGTLNHMVIWWPFFLTFQTIISRISLVSFFFQKITTTGFIRQFITFILRLDSRRLHLVRW